MFHQELQEENEKLKHLGGCSHGHQILGLGDHLFWSCLVNHLIGRMIGKMMGKYQSDLIWFFLICRTWWMLWPTDDWSACKVLPATLIKSRWIRAWNIPCCGTPFLQFQVSDLFRLILGWWDDGPQIGFSKNNNFIAYIVISQYIYIYDFILILQQKTVFFFPVS